MGLANTALGGCKTQLGNPCCYPYPLKTWPPPVTPVSHLVQVVVFAQGVDAIDLEDFIIFGVEGHGRRTLIERPLQVVHSVGYLQLKIFALSIFIIKFIRKE